MNIFDLYLDKITILIKKLNKEGSLELPESLNGINVDTPPVNFDCDISTNVSMVLSKINKKSPMDIANQLIPLIKKKISILNQFQSLNLDLLILNLKEFIGIILLKKFIMITKIMVLILKKRKKNIL